MSDTSHRNTVSPWLVTLASVLLVFGLWALVTQTGLVNDLFLPSPGEVVAGLLDLAANGYAGATLPHDILISLVRVLAGFLTGAALGTLIGLGMGYAPRIDAALSPFVEFLRPLPQLAYLVLLIVWFGIGELSKVMLLFLTALPVAAVAARDGVRNTSPIRLQAAQMLGASDWDIFRLVVLPSALPEIVTGARLALGIVYGTLIAAEMIAGSDGIGWMIMDAGRFLRSDYVFAGIAIIAALGLALDRLLVRLETRLVHWAGR
ncbi:ABC transporter permease [Rhodopila sp.]|uniref:ABC transporter permease n=1 Tax=Rhodopila sp. TaxID=2480087 RepID=UPI003D0991E9